jgi:hypothetical protein
MSKPAKSDQKKKYFVVPSLNNVVLHFCMISISIPTPTSCSLTAS